MSDTKRKPLAWGLIAAAILIVAMLGLLRFGGDKFAFVDYYDYHYAAQLIRTGTSPYDGEAADALAQRDGVHAIEGSHYIYPTPLALLLTLIPLSFLSPLDAGLLWSLLSGVFLLFALHGLSKHAQSKREQLLILLATLFVPTVFTLYVGQINTIVLALIILALEEAKTSPRRDFFVGLLLGVAALIKLSPLLLLVIFIVRGRWKVLLGAGTVMILMLLLGEVAVPGSTTEFFGKVLPSLWDIQPHHAHPANQSYRGWYLRILTENNWTTPVVALSKSTVGVVVHAHNAIVLLATVTALWNGRHHFLTRTRVFQEAGLIVACIVMISPLGWDHSFVFLLLPAAALWRTGRHGLTLLVYGLMIVQRVLFIPFADSPEAFPFLARFSVLSCCALLGAQLMFLGCACLLRKKPSESKA